MPNSTFFNLPDNKRNLIISKATEEFSMYDYATASINQICKYSNIAKGSFYQYFIDKQDLYVYIMTLAIEEKIKFFSKTTERFQTLSLLDQIRLLFSEGIKFANIYPKYAALGNQFSKETDKKVKSAVIREGEKQSGSLFIKMIEDAKSKDEIDKDIDSLSLSIILQSVNNAINEYMLDEFGEINYEYHEKDVDMLVDSILSIIFNGIKK